MSTTFKLTLLTALSCITLSLLSQDSTHWIKQSNSEDYNERQIAFMELAEIAFPDTTKSLNYLDQVLGENASQLDDSTYLKLMQRKIALLSKFYKDELTKKIAHNGLARAKRKNDSTLMAESLKRLSAAHYILRDYDSANIYTSEAAALYKVLGDQENYGLMLLRLGGIHYTKGDYSKALKRAFQASEIFKESNEERHLALAYMQMGNVYYFLEKMNQAANYYQLSEKYYLRIGDTLGAAHSLSNLGLTKIELDSFEVALKIQLKAYNDLKKHGNVISLGNTYHYLSEAYLGLGKIDSAEFYLNKCQAINQKINYTDGLLFNYISRGEIAFAKGKLDSAIYFGEYAYSVLDTFKNLEVEQEVAQHLSDWYEEKGNFKKAHSLLKRVVEIEDSVGIGVSSLEEIAFNQQGKLEKAEFELKLAKQKQLLVEEEKHNQQLLIVILAIVAVISIFFTGVLSAANRKNKNLNRLLKMKQEVVENELGSKRALLNEIHHRVKNNLQIISSMLSIQSQYVQDEQLDKIMRECRSRILSMSLIHESLYKREDSEHTLFSSYIQALIPQLVETYQVDQDQVNLEMNIEPLELSLDDSVPCGLIINEIVSNSLKHAFPDGRSGTIRIDFKREGNKIILHISDNGVGLNEMVDPENQDTFGFLLIYTMLNQLEADLSLDRRNGLSFKISWETKADQLLT